MAKAEPPAIDASADSTAAGPTAGQGDVAAFRWIALIVVVTFTFLPAINDCGESQSSTPSPPVGLVETRENEPAR
jgi:hypothetical protein